MTRRKARAPFKRWIECRSDTGSLHVSPRLVSLLVHLLDDEPDEEFCAQCMFEMILNMLPVVEFPQMHQPAELGWGIA